MGAIIIFSIMQAIVDTEETMVKNTAWVERKGGIQMGPPGRAGQALSRLPGHYLLPAGQGPPPTLAHPAQTHVPKVEGDFQLTPEAVREGRVHVQHLQQVCPLDLVQVAVGQGPHIGTGFAWLGMEVNRLPKDVILSCQPEGRGFL